ncbi:MAG: hypothetical protein ACE5IH_01280, partial [Thermodesulfobacteriota bacterium]
PYMRSEVTDGHFPTFSGIASHDISDMNIGGTFTFSYGLPTAFQTAWLQAGLQYDGSGGYADYGKELLLTENSGSIISGTPVSWTPTGGRFSIQAGDVFRREMRLFWMFD